MYKFNLSEILEDKTITINELSQMSGLSIETLTPMIEDPENVMGIDFKVLEKLISSLNISIGNLIEVIPEYTITVRDYVNGSKPIMIVDVKIKEVNKSVVGILSLDLYADRNNLRYMRFVIKPMFASEFNHNEDDKVNKSLINPNQFYNNSEILAYLNKNQFYFADIFNKLSNDQFQQLMDEIDFNAFSYILDAFHVTDVAFETKSKEYIFKLDL